MRKKNNLKLSTVNFQDTALPSQETVFPPQDTALPPQHTFPVTCPTPLNEVTHQTEKEPIAEVSQGRDLSMLFIIPVIIIILL